MDWIVVIQQAIDYIEDNLTETIDYEEIAKYIWENPQRWTDDEFYEE